MTADGVTRIDNAPLREAFRTSGLTASDLARRLGWYRRPSPGMRLRWADIPETVPDDTRVRAALGLKDNRLTLPYDQALAICRALGLDPVDVGL